MYVWDTAFFADTVNSGTVPCAGAGDLANWFDEASCFQQAWSNQALRSRLWASVRTGVSADRRVTRIALSQIKTIVEGSAPGSSSCDTPEARNLKATLREAHSPQVGVEVYGLLATSNAAFSERTHASYIVAWNEHCAANPSEQFDGIAINNEHFTSIKCSGGTDEAMLLDHLHEAKVNAGPLPVHFSLGWHWNYCSVGDGTVNEISWGPPGTSPAVKGAIEHMIDIVDSVDVQVAWNEADTMAQRAHTAGYDYFAANYAGGKQFFVLAYLNDVDDCRNSFFPASPCDTGDRTEDGVWDAFHMMADSSSVSDAVPLARGGLHYYHGVYGSGFPGWPEHTGSAVYPCAEAGAACVSTDQCGDDGYFCAADATCRSCVEATDEHCHRCETDGATNRCVECGPDFEPQEDGTCAPIPDCPGDLVYDSGTCVCPEGTVEDGEAICRCDSDNHYRPDPEGGCCVGDGDGCCGPDEGIGEHVVDGTWTMGCCRVDENDPFMCACPHGAQRDSTGVCRCDDGLDETADGKCLLPEDDTCGEIGGLRYLPGSDILLTDVCPHDTTEECNDAPYEAPNGQLLWEIPSGGRNLKRCAPPA